MRQERAGTSLGDGEASLYQDEYQDGEDETGEIPMSMCNGRSNIPEKSLRMK